MRTNIFKDTHCETDQAKEEFFYKSLPTKSIKALLHKCFTYPRLNDFFSYLLIKEAVLVE